MEWHPDKYDGEDKKHAEKMFMDIAAAKEVLTNPGMVIGSIHLDKQCRPRLDCSLEQSDLGLHCLQYGLTDPR